MKSRKSARRGVLYLVRSLVSGRWSLLTLMLALMMPMGASAQNQPLTITELFGFPSTGIDGTSPRAPVIQASDGNLYGTTTLGGNDGSGCVRGCAGTVFKLTLQGEITVLYTFASPYANGRSPFGGLVEGADGSLYGTTLSGGLSNHGVVFKISKTGQFQKLHDFCATGSCLPEGGNPVGSLIQGTDGNFYGTTSDPPAFPTVFQISPTGDYTVVASFRNSQTGISQGLLQASDGNFYGAGRNGVFRLTPDGTLTTLHLYCQPNDGCVGNGPLIQAQDGNLYGVTAGGGTGASGTVFRISLAGDYQKIFDMVRTVEGLSPNGLLQASDANLYGTTQGAGPPLAGGVVYEITTDGTLLRSASLTNETGIGSFAPLIQATDGKLYGTAFGAGSAHGTVAGTVFVVDAGLAPAPAVTLNPASLDFATQVVGTTSDPQSVMLTNTGSAPLNITAIALGGAIPGDYAFDPSTTCPLADGQLAAGDSCTIVLTFTPSDLDTRPAQVNITDNAADSPQSVPLTGVGIASAVPNGILPAGSSRPRQK